MILIAVACIRGQTGSDWIVDEILQVDEILYMWWLCTGLLFIKPAGRCISQ